MNTSFSDWLIKELQTRGISSADLSRQAGISKGAISHIINSNRNPGIDMCLGISRAFNLPPEEVYRKAGLLPSVPAEQEKTNELTYLASQLPPLALDDLIEFARHRLHLAEKRGEYKTE